jgi:hypothetical protein
MAWGNPLDLFNTNVADKANQAQQAGYTQAGQTLQSGYGQAGQDLSTNYAKGFQAWQPYLSQGQTLSPELTSLLSGGPDALKTLQSTPGYQFGLNAGQDATAAKMQQLGYGASGNEAKALSDWSTGYTTNQTYFPLIQALTQANQQGVQGAQGTSNLAQSQGQTQAGLDASLAGNLANLNLGSANSNAAAINAQNAANLNIGNVIGGGAKLASNLFGFFS